MRQNWFVGLGLAGLASLASASGAAAQNAEIPGVPPVFRIGVLGGDNAAYRITQAEPFRAYMEERLDIPVQLVIAPDYQTLIDAQIDGQVDYAVYSGTAFVTAEALCSCVEPIAAPAEASGAIGFYSILVVRADSGIGDVAGAAGARLALAEAPSVAGRLVPLDTLRQNGIDPDTHFAALIDAPSPEDAVDALLAGEADVAVAWSSLVGDAATGYSRGVLTSLVSRGLLTMDQVRIIWRSELIPYGPHAIRVDLPDTFKATVRTALLEVSSADPRAVDAIDQSGVIGFVEARSEYYDSLRRLVAMPEGGAPAAADPPSVVGPDLPELPPEAVAPATPPVPASAPTPAP